MKTKIILAILIVLSMLITSVGFAEDDVNPAAEDGVMFRRNVPKTPEQETERANINHMSFYVPVQTSSGEVLEGVDYYLADGTTVVDTRAYAKPLVAVYIDSMEEVHLGSGGAGMGHHDAHAALSLDDGATWKRTNLSNSAHLSSFTLHDGTPFPGDAHNMTFAIAGDKVLVGWISKYCDGGSPLYTYEEEDVLALQATFGLPDLYVRDIWGVAGSQSSVNYTLQGFPEVGEIPYSCVWSARGQLLEVDESGAPMVDGGFYDIVWTKAERLTSGRRDANRLEMNADGAAGFMMTWQEDPLGLRPGTGLGPGEGSSGAVVNQQTDLWYSFISIEDFDQVTDEVETIDVAVPLAEYAGDTVAKVAVPMAMPIRLTDNKMCKATGSEPYCYVDFNTDEIDGVVNPYANTDLPDDLEGITQSTSSTLCTATVGWTTPSGTTTLSLCETEDGRVLGGRVGASRPRVNVQPYNSLFIVDDEDDTEWYDSAIVIMGAEESKALGEGNTTEDTEIEDLGKNMWYYSFDLRNPEFVLQGGMLNQPAVDPETDAFFELVEDDFGNLFYETEISRRFSHFSQPIHQFGPSGISSVLIVKQGIINQGGPADIFLRMTKVPDDVAWVQCEMDGDDMTQEECLPEGYNPYAFENMVCEDLAGVSQWVYLPDSEDETRDGEVEANPRYIQGLCLSNMINVSGTSIVSCDGALGDCADSFPWDGVVDGSTFPKVTQWAQSGPNYGETVDETNIGNLHDQSWTNPYDVSKGHRGFIDGDFIMMMYAWSPNWQANSVGNDHYNLYARRSFDGGKTWTTLPQEFLDSVTLPEGVVAVADGTTTVENYKDGSTITSVPTFYAAGEFEQARNLSQLIGNRETILDPRYSPTGGIKMLPVTDLKEIGYTTDENGYLYPDDERDPSKYFIVYETGDNTTVAEGEAVPMDLFFSRASSFGDDYALVEYANTGTGEITSGFDWLEHDREELSGEAANTANNGGTYYYVIWNQWQEDEHENVSNSDAIFRRLMWLTDEQSLNMDYQPISSILYQSTDRADYDDEDIILVGTGRDLDRMGNEDPSADGIENVRWWSDIQGHICSERTMKAPPNGFIPGKHAFNFQVQDNEENWSRPNTVTIWIAEQFYDNYLPLVTR